jgi:hypothetical protein
MQVISFTRRKSAAHARSAHVRRPKEKGPAAVAAAQDLHKKSEQYDSAMLGAPCAWQRIKSLSKAMRLAAAAGDIPAYRVAWAEWLALIPEVRDEFDRIDNDRLRVAELSAWGLYAVPSRATPSVSRREAVSFTEIDKPVSRRAA